MPLNDFHYVISIGPSPAIRSMREEDRITICPRINLQGRGGGYYDTLRGDQTMPTAIGMVSEGRGGGRFLQYESVIDLFLFSTTPHNSAEDSRPSCATAYVKF